MTTRFRGIVAAALVVGGTMTVTLNSGEVGAKSPAATSKAKAVKFYKKRYGASNRLGSSPTDSYNCQVKQEATTLAGKLSNPPFKAPDGYAWKWQATGVTYKSETGRPTDYWGMQWSLCSKTPVPEITT